MDDWGKEILFEFKIEKSDEMCSRLSLGLVQFYVAQNQQMGNISVGATWFSTD